MPLRVAILCEYPTLNGGERSMLACVDRLSADDAAVAFIAPPGGPLANELRQRSLRQIPFDVHAVGDSSNRCEVNARLGEICREFDLLHANSLAMGRLTGAAGGALPCPTTAHLRDIVRLSRGAVDDLNGNGRLIAVSAAVRDFHVARGLSSQRTAVIYNGIDVVEFQRPRAGAIRRELGLSESDILVAAIGQICLRKGQDIFAEAAVRAAGVIPNLQFLLVGTRHSTKPESVAFEESIAARFQQGGMDDRLHVLGERTDVPGILSDTDILVHAARQEPFGRVLLEAAAAGVPIVATDVGGTREMLTHSESALLVTPDDPQAIADAVVRLSRDRGTARQLGSAARAHVAAQFPIDRAASELLATWRAVVG